MSDIIPTDDNVRSTLQNTLYRLLTPLIRILLRYGIAYGTFIDIAKHVYVQVAVNDFALPKRKQTDSRIAVLTGLIRQEVNKIRKSPKNTFSKGKIRTNRAARVLNGWIKDLEYLNGLNQPLVLSMESEHGVSFTSLARRYGGDIPAGAILDELLRLNAVEKLKDGSLRPLNRAYTLNADEVKKLETLGNDTALLIETIEYNLLNKKEKSFFQRKVAYDNLPEEAMDVLEQMIANRGQAFLEEFNTWLSTQDREDNPKVKGSGRKYAGIGIYLFQKDWNEKTFTDE